MEIPRLRAHWRLGPIEGRALRTGTTLELLRALVHATATMEIAWLRAHRWLGSIEGRALRTGTVVIPPCFCAVRISVLIVAVARWLWTVTVCAWRSVALTSCSALGIPAGFRAARDAEFVWRDFAVAVAIHFAKCLGGLVDLCGIDGAIVVCVEHAKHSGGGTLNGQWLRLSRLRIILCRERESGKDHGDCGDERILIFHMVNVVEFAAG